MPGFRALGAEQPVVDGELALAFESGVKSVGSGVLLQRRQKVFGYHHGGAVGVGGGPAPVAARGLQDGTPKPPRTTATAQGGASKPTRGTVREFACRVSARVVAKSGAVY